MSKKVFNCPHCGKLISPDLWKETRARSQKTVKCPLWGSQRVYKNGFGKTASGDKIQRYLCNECAYRFSNK